MDKEAQSPKNCENCLVCGTSQPEGDWVDETYEAQGCRFCSPHCQARFEAVPQKYVADAGLLWRPLGYSSPALVPP